MGLSWTTLFLSGLLSQAIAADRQPAGLNSLKDLKPEAHNGNYLAKTNLPASNPTSLAFSNIVSKDVQNQLNTRYNDLAHAYQQKENHSLNSMQDEIRYQKANEELVQWTIKETSDDHLKSTLKAAEKRSKSEISASAVNAVETTKQALTESNIEVSESVKTKMRYHLPSGRTRMDVQTPVADASVQYQAYRVKNQADKLTVQVRKEIPSLKALAKAHYSVNQGSVHYELQKVVTNSVSARVDHVQNLNQARAGETALRLEFGMRF